jgi:hypothetical protein
MLKILEIQLVRLVLTSLGTKELYTLIVQTNMQVFEVLCTELSREADRVDLVVSPDKTKYMKFSAFLFPRSMKGATINGVTYEGVIEFIYLGTLISNDNSVQKEIQRQILAANRTYFAVISFFRNRLLSRATKFQLYKTLIRPVVTYGAETWTMTKTEEKDWLIFERKIFRRIYGPKYEDGEWKIRTNRELEVLNKEGNIVK